MISRAIGLMSLVILAGASPGLAEHLEKGDKELVFRFRYSNLEFDHLGSNETAEVRGRFAYMLTKRHEILDATDFNVFGGLIVKF